MAKDLYKKKRQRTQPPAKFYLKLYHRIIVNVSRLLQIALDVNCTASELVSGGCDSLEES